MTTATGAGALRHRFASMRLGAKLAWLSAGLTALFIAAIFVLLGVSTRRATIEAITNELHQTQAVLRAGQSRELARLEYTAQFIGQAANIRAALRSVPSTQRGPGRPRIDTLLVSTAERALADALPSVRQDLIIITDDSGRVFATASRQRGVIPNGTELGKMAAVRFALDPAVPIDTGAYGVLHLPSGDFSVVAVPLVLEERTLGTVLLGQRIDSGFVGSARVAFNGDVVVTSGDSVIISTRAGLVRADVQRLAAARSETSPRLQIGGEEFLGAPLPLGENQTGQTVTVWLLQPLSRVTGFVTRPMLVQFLLYGLIAVVLTGVGAAAVSESVLRPFYAFITHMRGVTPTSEPRRRFESIDASPEIRTLDESFATLMQSLAQERSQLERRTVELAAANTGLREEVAERERVEHALRESEAQLRQSQKLEAIGTLAGGVAHDFNNLLTVITGYTQLALMRTPAEDSMREDLKQVVEASDRAARLTHQLLAFSRKQVLQPTVIDPQAVVDGVAPMLRRLIGEHIALNIETLPPLSRIIADRGQLEQVIINLVVNARDAMPRGGTITIRTANVHVRNDPRVMLSVSDSGVGIPPDVRDRIFEPFFTTKEAGKGTGLGLSMVYGIVKQSGGTIELESEVGKGTTFTVFLPRGIEASTVDGTEKSEPLALPRGTETILLVEDELDVRALTRRTLEALGYTVVTSTDADDAIRLGTTSRIDVVLSDIIMPVMSGPQVVTRLAEKGVRPIIVYMSGYADDALDGHELEPESTFMPKPFAPAELARVIREAIDRNGGRRS